MLLADQIRRWRRLGFCGLLCVVVSGLAISQTSSTPSKPAQPPTAPAKKSQHRTTGHTATKRTSSHTTKSSRGKKGSRKRGQQAIDSQRAREIQQALIRERYLEGEPSGKWDSATQAAMQRYQADQGFQSKTIPDARALIKLGLGPSTDHLLNPESAMTATPLPADPTTPAKHAATDPPAGPTTPAGSTPPQH